VAYQPLSLQCCESPDIVNFLFRLFIESYVAKRFWHFMLWCLDEADSALSKEVIFVLSYQYVELCVICVDGVRLCL
jgi:hypothetical protein